MCNKTAFFRIELVETKIIAVLVKTVPKNSCILMCFGALCVAAEGWISANLLQLELKSALKSIGRKYGETAFKEKNRAMH